MRHDEDPVTCLAKMEWEHALKLILAGAAVLVTFAVALFTLWGRFASDPVSGYDLDSWGPAIRAGEQIGVQAQAFQLAAWWLRLNPDPSRNASPIGRQLALTSTGALLVAERRGGRLWDRRRYETSTLVVDKVKRDSDGQVSLRLLLPNRKMSLYQVPRSFLDGLRSTGARVDSVG